MRHMVAILGRARNGETMRVRNVMIGAAMTATLTVPALLLAAVPGSAEEPPPPGAATISNVRPVIVASRAGQTASAQFHYVCQGTVETDHLYVGIKQGPEVNATDHTSSEFADTFYSTNWASDQGTNALKCDGKRHVLQAALAPDPFFAEEHPDAPALKSGQVFLQVCVFDSSGLAFDYTMKKVVIS